MPSLSAIEQAPVIHAHGDTLAKARKPGTRVRSRVSGSSSLTPTTSHTRLADLIFPAPPPTMSSVSPATSIGMRLLRGL